MKDQDSIRELEVGTIIVATGYDLVDPGQFKQWGYGRSPRCTRLEFERLCNAMGPTSGKIVRRTAGARRGRHPSLHRLARRELLQALLARVLHVLAQVRPPAAREDHGAVFEFYIDMRAFGKGYEEFYDRVMHEGTRFVRQGRAGACAQRGRRRRAEAR